MKTEAKFNILSNVARSIIARKAIVDFNLSRVADGSFKRYAQDTGKQWVADACQNVVTCAMQGALRATNLSGYRAS